MIELECLAVAWAAKKCDVFLRGQPLFTILVDHKPLVPMLNSYPLSAIDNPRLQRLKEKLSGFTFHVEWRPGKSHCIPDALSSAPIDDPVPSDLMAEDSDLHIHSLINALDATLCPAVDASLSSDPILDLLRREAARDTFYQELVALVVNGFPSDPHRLSSHLRPYYPFQHELSIDQGLILRGTRIIVPTACRRDVLTRLHAAHQGLLRTKQRARQAVYWPSITSYITSLEESCSACQELLPSQPQEPLLSDDSPPTRIFESTSADFFSVHGKHFLIYADRFSGWPSVTTFATDPTTASLRLALAEHFANTGIPLRLRSDGGPQFTSLDFTSFCSQWGIRHTTSSPTYAQSNGHAEANVKKLKHLIIKTVVNGNLKTEPFYKGLLELRNTPMASGHSPAEIIFNAPMRTRVPLHYSAFLPTARADAAKSALKAADYLTQAKANYDRSAHELPPLKVSDRVRLQDATSKRWRLTRRIVRLNRARDYIVKLDNGSVLRRNRRFLHPDRSTPPATLPAAPASQDAPRPRHSLRAARPPTRYSNSNPQSDV